MKPSEIFSFLHLINDSVTIGWIFFMKYDQYLAFSYLEYILQYFPNYDPYQ